MHPGEPFLRLFPGFSPTFVPAGIRKRAQTDGPSPTPLNLFAMEFLNKIELRGIVGQASLNRVGDSQVCRFSLVTEYSYKDRSNNPIVDVTCYSNR